MALGRSLRLWIESGKLFFTGRAFHSDNLVIAALGALAGVIFFPRFCVLASVKRHREAIWFMGCVVIVECVVEQNHVAL